jgi:hypothetical protein
VGFSRGSKAAKMSLLPWETDLQSPNQLGHCTVLYCSDICASYQIPKVIVSSGFGSIPLRLPIFIVVLAQSVGSGLLQLETRHFIHSL